MKTMFFSQKYTLRLLVLMAVLIAPLWGFAQTSYTVNCYPPAQTYATGYTSSSSKTSGEMHCVGGSGVQGWMKFDVSSIPDIATISSIKLHFYNTSTNNCYVKLTAAGQYDPVNTAASTLYTAITNTSTNYYTSNNISGLSSSGWKTFTLSSSAVSNLKSPGLANDYFTIGFYEYESSSSWYLYAYGYNNSTYKPYIEVTYTLPVTTMQCGTTYSGTLGTSGVWSTYTNGSWTEPGEEHVYAYTPPVTGSYTFHGTNDSGDADFFLMEECSNTSNGLGCWSSGNKTFNSLTGGHTYYLIADNYSSSDNANYTVSVDCPTFNITVWTSGGGSVSGGGTYAYNSSCTVTATPSTGYVFDHWILNGNQNINSSSYTFTVTDVADFQAVFAQQYSLSWSNPTGGTISVTQSGSTVSSGTYYPANTQFNITASPSSSNYAFTGWTATGGATLGDANSASTTLTIGSSNCTLTANFTEVVVMTNNATHTACSGIFTDSGGTTGSYANDEEMTMTFYPGTSGKMVRLTFNSFETESGWDYLYIYNGTSTSETLIGSYSGTTSPGTVTASNCDGALTVHFSSDGSFTYDGWAATISCVDPSSYTISKSVGTGGSVTVATSALACSTVNMTISVNSGYELASISVTDANNNALTLNGSGNSRSFTMPFSNVTVTATFTRIYSLTWSNPSGGTIAVTQNGNTVTSGSSFPAGTQFSITATPDPNAEFTGWTVSGTGSTVANLSSASTTLTLGTANATLAANFLVPASLPYTCNFETTSENDQWRAGNSTDGWFVGTATYSSSNHSIYVSANNGTANTYGQNDAKIYAYREISIPSEDIYVVSFKWKCVGESSNDYMRAFLVPKSINPNLSGGANNSIGTSTTPSNWISVDGGTKLNLNSSWTTLTPQMVTISSSGIYYLVFYWCTDGSWTGNDGTHGSQNPPAAVDDIDIHVAPRYTLSWSNPSGGTINVTQNGNTVTSGSSFIQGTQFSISFTPNNGYAFNGWSVSGTGATLDNASSNSTTLTLGTGNATLSVSTVGNIQTIPYTETFESYSWTFVNGSRTNKWYRGEAGARAGGYGLFISNDGTNNTYSIDYSSAVWAYKALSFGETTTYIISFDWKAYGESCCDYIRVGLVPYEVELTDGTSFSAPTGWIDLNGGSVMNLKSTWQRKTVVMTVNAGAYKLAFCWRNDDSVGSDPPAAIDNVVVKKAFTITASTSGSGSVTGAGTYPSGQPCSVIASPGSCAKFVNWTENGSVVSTDRVYSFTLSANRNLVANFETWTVDANTGNVTTECITSGTSLTLTAGTDLPSIPSGLAGYGFQTGVDASKWYSVTSTTNIMTGGTTTGDYAYSSVQTMPDGFSFPFGGTNYTQFSVNADGNLRLGSTVTGTSYYNTPFSSSNASYDNPKINGMGFDGYFDTSNYGNYVHAQLFGASPNRVFVVEFYESPYSTTTRPNPWKWQVQLFENGDVQIVYNSDEPQRFSYTNQIGMSLSASDIWLVNPVTHTPTHYTSGTSVNNPIQDAWPGASRYYRFTAPPAAPTYTWTCDAGTSGTASNNVYTVSPTALNNTYTVSVTYNGCTQSESVNVSVVPPTPTNITFSNITSTTATASWNGGIATSWEYSINGGSTWNSTSSTTVNLTGLTAGTNYTFQVKAVNGSCNSNIASNTFSTLSTYTVTYTANGGSGSMTDSNSPYDGGSTVTVMANGFTAPSANYIFGIWNTAANGSGTSYAAGSTFTITANTTLYAQWAPIHIANATQWNEFSTVVNEGFTYSGQTVYLDADITVTTTAPVGTSSKPFQGTFEGNGHVVNYTHSANVDHKGLFGYVSGSGNIQNVIVNATLSGTSTSVGAVVGTFASSGTISNVEGAGTISSSSTNAGGLVGNMTNGTIHSSFAVATLSGSATNKGGLVGRNSGNLYNCYSNATYSNGTNKGGLVGNNSGTVENCYAAGIVSGVYAFAASNSGTIRYCYADAQGSGLASGTAPVGSGLFGAVQSDIKHLDYMFRDNIIPANTNTYVGGSGVTSYVDNHKPVWNGLVSALNQWVRANPRSISGLTSWHRPVTTNINGDLPVLAFPKDNSLGTLNSDGKFLRYGSNQSNATGIDALLTTYNGGAAASIFHYGKASGVTGVPSSNVHVYIQEDAVLLQAASPDPGAFINTTVGVTFDNSDHGTHAYDFWGNRLNYDWHLMSSPLRDAKIGTRYNTYTESGDPNSAIDIKSMTNSYFPNGLPMSLHDATWKWDFYSYYEPDYHWINLKRNKNNHYHQDGGAHITYNQLDQADSDAASDNCVFLPGKGYMMAISQNTFMNSYGTLNRGSVNITLTNQEPDSEHYSKGWNLVGNPYQAYLDLEAMNRLPVYIYDAEQGIYVPYAKESSSNPVLPSQYIHPHQAFFMHAEPTTPATTEAFTFQQAWATTDSNAASYFRDEHLDYPLVNLFAENSIGQRDLTVVEFHRPEIGGAPKLDAMRNMPFTLAAHHNGTAYGILFSTDDMERIPVHFKTDEDDQMTLTWSIYNGEFSQLHLFDNLLGVNYDMLSHDSYTFTARASDYASRFYITYECTGVDEDDDSGGPGGGSFAYVSHGNIVVDVTTGSGTSLQLVDMLGRVLYSTVCTDGVHTISTNGLAKGVYLIRLTTNKSVRTQKLIVQ